MISKQALQEWLDDLPIDAQVAIECEVLVALHDARALEIGEAPADWCTACGGSRGEHRPTCDYAAWEAADTAKMAQSNVLTFNRRRHASAQAV